MPPTTKRQRPKMTFNAPADPPQPVGAVEQPPAPSRPLEGNTTVGQPQQASRLGKRAVTFYVSPDAFRQLGVLSAQSDRTVQSLMQEALDFLFQHHGLHRIAKE